MQYTLFEITSDWRLVGVCSLKGIGLSEMVRGKLLGFSHNTRESEVNDKCFFKGGLIYST